MRFLVASVALVAIGGCLALGSLDGFTVGGGGTGGTGGGAAGGAGGSGGSAGNGGGGMAPCTGPDACGDASDIVVPFTATGGVTITDVDRVEQGGVVVVGIFSGTLSLPDGGGSQPATNATDGFIVELEPDGSYRNHELVEEADDTGRLFVDYDPNGDVIVVGGSAATPGGSCTAAGFFARAFDRALTDQIGDRCLPATGTAYDVVGIVPNSDTYANVVGSFTGMIDTEGGPVTATNLDGAVVGFSSIDTPSADVISGAGDEVIRAVENNSGMIQTLFAGDFTENAVITHPKDNDVDLTASGGSDVFLVSTDGAGNEFVVEHFSGAGTHRAVGLALNEGDTRGVLLVEGTGPFAVPTQSAIDMAPSSVAVVDFIPPIGDVVDTPLMHIRTSRLAGPGLSAVDLSLLASGAFFIGGQADGVVTVEDSDGTCGTEAFLLLVDGPQVSARQRCGTGGQTVGGVTHVGTDGLVAVFNVPANETIMLAGNPHGHTQDAAYVLIQP